MNHGSSKIVRHEALRRPPKGRCDTQAFRIIQPGKEQYPEVDPPNGWQRPQVLDQKALHVGTEERPSPYLFRAQEDHHPAEAKSEPRDPREAGGEDDGQAGSAPGRDCWRKGSRRGWSHHVSVLVRPAEVRGEPVAHLGEHGIAAVIDSDDVPGAVNEDELLLTGAKSRHQTLSDPRADAVVLP